MDYRTVVKICLLFLAVNIQLASAATHSMQYMVTEVTPGISFPEYTMVGMVDGEQFVYYDSNSRKVVPKTEWMKKNEKDDYWKDETQVSHGNEESYKLRMYVLMQRFNQSKGVHTFQWMYSCQQNDNGTKGGYVQYGYDGEDFISLDLNSLTWIAPVPQAFPTKHKWEVTEGGVWAAQIKNYLMNECIEWLQKYVGYGRSTLERKVHPEVDLFSSDSSSPVVCHATGFFPKAVNISWQKNGEELNEDVELRETLPNQDGSFQKRSILTVSPEELKNGDKYTCVVQHSSLEKDVVLKVSDRRILSGGVSVGVIVGVLVAALIVIIAIVGAVVWKKKNGFKRVPASDSSSNNS